MAKLEIGFAEKKTYDKRESLKEQDTKRDLDRIKRFTTIQSKVTLWQQKVLFFKLSID
jgi:hypothetical protein